MILALTPQQVELVRFAQLDGNLSLVLRSTADQGRRRPTATSGITLRDARGQVRGASCPSIVLGTIPRP